MPNELIVPKAITLWQPYAQSIAQGIKKYETRGWPTKYRGLLAIHASVRKLDQEQKTLADKYCLDNLPLGAIVSVVMLEDCILMTKDFIRQQTKQEIEWGDWREGRWAWKLTGRVILETPVAVKGKQGLWNVNNVKIYT